MPVQDSPDDALQFRLISVSFKEAALDSPSFRASVNHLNGQVLNIRQWAEAMSSAVTKYPGKINDMRSFVNSYLEYLVPGFVQDGLLDQEYTVPALRSTLSSLKQLWSISLAYLTINSGKVMEASNKIHEVVSKYSKLRAEFEAAQDKYDRYLDIYMASSKTKSPSMAIEDAVQLYNARKDYLHASLDLVVGISRVHIVYDKAFINMSVDFWMRKKSIVPGGGLANLFAMENRRIIRTKAWFESYGSAMESLAKDMLVARDQVEESTLDLFAPSPDPNSYDSSLINSNSLREIDEPSNEKHGYLLMKTWIKANGRPVWVKRWVFIKGGVFGLLVLSPSRTFVQETDKIGLLLSKVRYAPQEERRFCFEVKTVDMTLTFQAESLIQLKSWLKVFENEVSRLHSLPEDSEAFKIAMGRYPPIIREFASTVDTVVDKELTNRKILNSQGQIVTSSDLSNKIKKNEKYFQDHLYYQIPQIKPALITSNTKTAIIAYTVAAPTALPTALTANTWGSINWGLYYLQTSSREPHREDEVAGPTIPGSVDIGAPGTDYPAYYPPNLVSFDIEMRSIFESALESGEICLLTFSYIWAPNSQQELSGRMFITNRHVLLYNQAMGFVSLYKGSFARLAAVDVSVNENFDALNLYLLDDVIHLKVFVDDGELIQKKLSYLIENRVKDKPDSFEMTLGKLANIETEFYKSMKGSEMIKNPDDPSGSSIKVVGHSNGFTEYKIDYSSTANVTAKHRYAIPAKAVFHIFCGDYSTFFFDVDSVGVAKLIRKNWYHTNDGLKKQFVTKPPRSRMNGASVLFKLHVESRVENEYYNVTYTREWFRLFGTRFKVVHRLVIVADTSESCKLYLYSNLVFDSTKLFNGWAKTLVTSLTKREFGGYNSGLKRIHSRLGDSGQAAKAIYLYGRLTVVEGDEKDLTVPDCVIGVRDTVYHVLITGIAITVAEILKILITACGFAKRSMKQLSIYRFLLLCLGISMIFNISLVGKSSVDYWKARGVAALANKVLHSDPMMLQRALYLKDYEEITKFNQSQLDDIYKSTAYDTFKAKSFVRNFDKIVDWDAEYVDNRTKRVAQELQKTFKDIGVKRHELLVQFNILNDMEKQIARGEWVNWLLSELAKCEMVENSNLQEVLKEDNSTDTTELEEGINAIHEYCRNCEKEYQRLMAQ